MHTSKDSMWRKILKKFRFLGESKQDLILEFGLSFQMAPPIKKNIAPLENQPIPYTILEGAF